MTECDANLALPLLRTRYAATVLRTEHSWFVGATKVDAAVGKQPGGEKHHCGSSPTGGCAK